MLIVVIAVFEMPLGIPGTARHGPYRQHEPTLTLFEFAMQLLSCFAVLIAAPMQKPAGAKPTPSLPVLRSARPESASLIFVIPGEERSRCALKIDTIPKPDGLG
jgi:hypothetical protein